MQKIVRYSLAALGLVLLAQFSSQDNNNGSNKPKVNFYGTITDSSDKTFDAENIVAEGLYKQIPVYQVPPQKVPTSYEPSDNITRLDLSEINKITVDPEQAIQTIKSRKYIVIRVYSKTAPEADTQNENNNKKNKKRSRAMMESSNPLINNYLVEADKKLSCDETNPAGPIEKEIRFKALKEVVFEGFEQAASEEDAQNQKNSPAKKIKVSDASNSKRKRLITYIHNLFAQKRAA